MPELEGSKTQTNLEAAFASASQASVRYLAFAQRADHDGHGDVAALFRSLAEAENERALGHLELLAGADATEDDLKSAIEGATYEYTEALPGFAAVARDEGFDDIADRLDTEARSLKTHADRFTHGFDSLR